VGEFRFLQFLDGGITPVNGGAQLVEPCERVRGGFGQR